MALLYMRFVHIDEEHVKERISEEIGEIVEGEERGEVWGLLKSL